MAVSTSFQEAKKSWLHIGDGANDTLVGDGPFEGTWYTKDELRGGGGDDYLDGQYGRNILFGQAGDDQFAIGKAGDGSAWDRAYGGKGSDVFDAYDYLPEDGHLHLANGGGGLDTVLFKSYGLDIPITLRNEKVILEGTTTIRLRSIENLVGGAGDDRIKASGAIRTVEGGRGDDRLSANDDIGSTLIGGYGSDTLRGGDAADFLYDHFDLRDGRPEYSDPDSDRLFGGKKDDYLLSYSGNDTLVGGDGSDTLVSLAGTDVIRGGDGWDLVRFAEDIGGFGETDGQARLQSSLDGLVIDGGADGKVGDTVDFAGLDLAHGALEEGVRADLARGRGWEMSALDGPGEFRIRDIENLSGTERDDRLIGSAEDNILIGNGGDDILKGGPGRDHLNGSEGKDRLFGGTGTDELWSSDDGDIMTGGADADLFGFNAFRDATLTITDFELGADLILCLWEDFDTLERRDTDAGARVTGDGGSTIILLEGIHAADLTASDFSFF